MKARPGPSAQGVNPLCRCTIGRSTKGGWGCTSTGWAVGVLMDEALIERMDRSLAVHRPDYYVLLRTGATDVELDAFESQYSLKLPTAFRQL